MNADISTAPVLLVEDEETDAILVRVAFEEASISTPLFTVPDGKEACDYLAGTGAYLDRTVFPFPRLVLLDLKLPNMSGFDVLSWIRARHSLSSLIVVVLSSSAHSCDLERAYSLGANAYLVKPATLAELVDMCKALKGFWLQQNRQLTLKIWELAGVGGPPSL